jgi:DHA1 family multidrug resistance protein-like MFS transporter
MTDLIREAPLGQIIRYVSGNKLFLYQDEKPDFRCPNSYAHPETGKYSPSSLNASAVVESIEENSEEKVARDVEELEPKLTRTSTAAHCIMSFTGRPKMNWVWRRRNPW